MLEALALGAWARSWCIAMRGATVSVRGAQPGRSPPGSAQRQQWRGAPQLGRGLRARACITLASLASSRAPGALRSASAAAGALCLRPTTGLLLPPAECLWAAGCASGMVRSYILHTRLTVPDNKLPSFFWQGCCCDTSDSKQWQRVCVQCCRNCETAATHGAPTLHMCSVTAPS